MVLVCSFALSLSAAPKKSAAIAPAEVEHPIALFLSQISNAGKRQVTFKASAIGTRFFFEEAAGVTVYRFANGKYVKEAFLSGAKLATAMKRYGDR